jgi:hypothetical protein
MVVWRAANGICSKRLVPFLPELVPILESHGHLTLDDEVRAQVLSMSAATADRMVRRLREVDRPHGISTTKPDRLLKRQVPVRTFSEWARKHLPSSGSSPPPAATRDAPRRSLAPRRVPHTRNASWVCASTHGADRRHVQGHHLRAG